MSTLSEELPTCSPRVSKIDGHGHAAGHESSLEAGVSSSPVRMLLMVANSSAVRLRTLEVAPSEQRNESKK